MANNWIDEHGRLLLWDHVNNRWSVADEYNKMCPFTLAYCSSIDLHPGLCFKDACELWDPEEQRCSLSDRVRR